MKIKNKIKYFYKYIFYFNIYNILSLIRHFRK